MTRTGKGRRARTVVKTTPRRWLPLVLFAVGGLAAGFLAWEDTGSEQVTSIDVPVQDRLSVASGPDPLTTSWFCSAGTALGEGGEAELAAVIANAGSEPVRAEVIVYGTDVSISGAAPDPGSEPESDSEGESAETGDESTPDTDDDDATSGEDDSGEPAEAPDEQPETQSPQTVSEVISEVVDVEVPARGRVRVTASDVIEAEWAAMAIEVFGGRATVERQVSGPLGFDLGGCSPSGSTEWYLPSGSTLRGSTYHLSLFNPYEADAVVDVAFTTEDGSQTPAAFQGVSVPGRSVKVMSVDNPARRREVAAVITSRGPPVVVDRLQTFDGSGDPVTGADGTSINAPVGVSATSAIPRPARRWFYPEARLVSGGRTLVAIQNPGSTTSEVELVVRYEDPARYPEIDPIAFEVAAGDHHVVDLTAAPDLVADIGFTVDVRVLGGSEVATEMVLQTGDRAEARVGEAPPDEVDDDESDAEGETETEADHDHDQETEGEAEAGDDEFTGGVAPSTFAPGYSVSSGSPVVAGEWFLPLWGSSPGRDVVVTVANPGDDDVVVTVAQPAGGSVTEIGSATITIPAGDRRILVLDDAVGSEGLVVSADGGVVVARLVSATEEDGLSLNLVTPFPDSGRDLPPTP